MSSNQNKFKLILEFIELVKQKPEWEIEHLSDLLKINQDDFEYIINTVSDLYISNDFDLLLDIEIDNEKIKILINEVATTTHLITDMDLLSIYKILLDANIDFLESYIPSDYLTTFKDTIDKYIPTQVDTIDTIKLNDFNLFEGENITIEYSPLGTISSYKYRIKPLSIVNNVEGVALLALDVTANKTKTFLINRIVNISNEILDSLKTKKTTVSEKYIFEFSFRDGYDHLPELVDGIRFNKKNIYSVAFRNKDIALEFYKLNIYKIKAIDNNTFDDEINSSFNKVIKLINK